MILEFSVANYLSFKERVTFSMIANAGDELSDNYIVKNDKKILKTAAIYGANASGKSNLFKILHDVVFMIRRSNNLDINDKLPIEPFAFDKKCQMMPSEFEIKFIADGVRYVYGFRADNESIYEEYLYYYPNGREAKIFDRININTYSYGEKGKKVLKEIEIRNARNKFFLATATNWNYEKTKKAYDFISLIGVCFDLQELERTAFEIYSKNDIKLKKFALKQLKKADFNITDFRISKINLPIDLKWSKNSYNFYKVEFKHNGSDAYIDYENESLGTKMFFSLIPFLEVSLTSNRVLVVDELDKSLHPHLVEYILKLFNNPKINKSGSQLIFNTHDTNLLDLNILRRDQVWFTEKNNETGESDLYQLSDFSVRKTEDVEKGYIIGRYGAIPFINNDLDEWEK